MAALAQLPIFDGVVIEAAMAGASAAIRTEAAGLRAWIVEKTAVLRRRFHVREIWPLGWLSRIFLLGCRMQRFCPPLPRIGLVSRSTFPPSTTIIDLVHSARPSAPLIP